MKSRTIRGDRLHIGFFGKRNAGKSSLINALSNQQVAIVSNTPGTTTDPVYKSMEFAPLGPVVLIDTAGLDDDNSQIGEQRKEKSKKIFAKTDFALLTIDISSKDFTLEEELKKTLEKEDIPYLIVLNKIDLPMSPQCKEWLKETPFVRVSASQKEGINELKLRIAENAPKKWEPDFIKDLIHPQDIVALVTPIDLGAPKGRLIMPQVKALRDILDADAMPIMCKERELISTLEKLKEKPALVITDSQVFPQVSADVPLDIKLTSFSILSARQKGDLHHMVDSLLNVKRLKKGDKVLIAESCTHHPLEDDIGRVKIPRWLNNYVGGGLEIDTVPGFDYPSDLKKYKLIIHCGACTLNRKEMLKRESYAMQAGVPMTNYGLIISLIKNVFPRALEPFPELYKKFKKGKASTCINVRKKMAVLTEV